MQAIQVSIQGHVPVTPTEESQTDKGIDHPLVSCDECDAVWRSYAVTRCPKCARQVGTRFLLDEQQLWDLVEAVSYLDETATFDPETESETCEFRNLLAEHVQWYNTNSRVTIQACYEALCARDPHPNITFAIAFFKAEYAEAPEDEMMYSPDEEDEDVPYYQVNTQYDLAKPSW
jgi:hypothetical protein